jgi:hypothetical protein
MRIVMGIKYKVTMAPQGFRPLARELILKLTFVHLLLATLDSEKCLDITKPAKYTGYTIGICPRFVLSSGREFMPKTIVMIHGMWGGGWYWENYSSGAVLQH